MEYSLKLSKQFLNMKVLFPTGIGPVMRKHFINYKQFLKISVKFPTGIGHEKTVNGIAFQKHICKNLK